MKTLVKVLVFQIKKIAQFRGKSSFVSRNYNTHYRVWRAQELSKKANHLASKFSTLCCNILFFLFAGSRLASNDFSNKVERKIWRKKFFCSKRMKNCRNLSSWRNSWHRYQTVELWEDFSDVFVQVFWNIFNFRSVCFLRGLFLFQTNFLFWNQVDEQLYRKEQATSVKYYFCDENKTDALLDDPVEIRHQFAPIFEARVEFDSWTNCLNY